MIAEKTEKTSGCRSLNLSYLIGFEPVKAYSGSNPIRLQICTILECAKVNHLYYAPFVDGLFRIIDDIAIKNKAIAKNIE